MTPIEYRRWTDSINTKFAIILAVLLLGIFSNGLRTYMDLKDDGKVKRIRILNERVAALESKLEACESGTPMPLVTSVRVGSIDEEGMIRP